jgi:hypothetical protein
MTHREMPELRVQQYAQAQSYEVAAVGWPPESQEERLQRCPASTLILLVLPASKTVKKTFLLFKAC